MMGLAITAGSVATGQVDAKGIGEGTTAAAGALEAAKVSGANALSDALAAVADEVNASVVTIFVETEIAGRPELGGDRSDGDFFGEEILERIDELDKMDSKEHASSEGESDYQNLGFTPADVNGDVAQKYGLAEDQQGVVIIDVAPGNIAEGTGLLEGDVVLDVDRKPMASVDDIQGIIGDAGPGDNTLLHVLRGDAYVFVTCEFLEK